MAPLRHPRVDTATALQAHHRHPPRGARRRAGAHGRVRLVRRSLFRQGERGERGKADQDKGHLRIHQQARPTKAARPARALPVHCAAGVNFSAQQ